MHARTIKRDGAYLEDGAHSVGHLTANAVAGDERDGVAAAVLCADLCVCVLFVSTAARTNGGKRKRKRTTPALSPPKGRLNAVAVGALGVIAVLSMARGALSVTARRASWRASMVRDPPAHKPGARGGGGEKNKGRSDKPRQRKKRGKASGRIRRRLKKKQAGSVSCWLRRVREGGSKTAAAAAAAAARRGTGREPRAAVTIFTNCVSHLNSKKDEKERKKTKKNRENPPNQIQVKRQAKTKKGQRVKKKKVPTPGLSWHAL